MAIFHLTVSVVSRRRGQSAVAAAAYRTGTVLRDERYAVTHDYRGRGMQHLQIMVPADAPAWTADRERLWNAVESRELRRDAQLARVVEVGLPVELSAAAHVALLQDFVATEFVARGMIADFCIREAAVNPQAHILLTLRRVTAAGFGPKERRWNGKASLLEWRAAWAERTNAHLARAGHDVRIDHRTLAAQGIELRPGRRLGMVHEFSGTGERPRHMQAWLAEQRQIIADNARTLLDDPSIALHALTLQRSTFTRQDLVDFLRTRTADAGQLAAVLEAVIRAPDLIPIGAASGSPRFTTRDLLEAEKSLRRRCVSMSARRGHGVSAERRQLAAAQCLLGEAARREFDGLVADGDLAAVAVNPATKAQVLQAALRAWTAEGLAVFGTAATPTAARALHACCGITLRSDPEQARPGGLPGGVAGEYGSGLDRHCVLLVDGAEMLGVRRLERMLAVADGARAKLALIADVEQFAAMREPPFGAVLRATHSRAAAGYNDILV